MLHSHLHMHNRDFHTHNMNDAIDKKAYQENKYIGRYGICSRAVVKALRSGGHQKMVSKKNKRKIGK